MTQEVANKVIPKGTPALLIDMAIAQGADLEKLEKLIAMQERWDANEARKAFLVSMNNFKANPPAIIKDKHVSYGSTSYDYATLTGITSAITTGLAKHDLSHRWNIEQLDGGAIKVTCIVTHAMGHSESVSLQAGADQSGSKNSVQSIGSTTTYLQRYTLLSATGLAAGTVDDDARTAATSPITDLQVKTLKALIKKVKADEALFLTYMDIDSIASLTTDKFERACKALNAKKKKEGSDK